MTTKSAHHTQFLFNPTQALARSIPVFLALLAIGGIYLILPDHFSIGPRWLPIGLIVLFVVVLSGAIYRGYFRISRVVSFILIAIVTLAEAVSTSALIYSIVSASSRTAQVPHAQALLFLRDAALIWLVNIFTFAFWYWEIDAGGPAKRHHYGYESTDFVFPQDAAGDGKDKDWLPHFVDYLFLAFNTSTAFSPTDTLVLSVRAKLLMMTQSLISLIVLAVIVARGINTL